MMFIFVHLMQKNNESIILRFAFWCCASVKLADIVRSCKR